MSEFACSVCGNEFESLQEDGFASWGDSDGITCYYGSRYDGLYFKWKDSSYEGAICDDCIEQLINTDFLYEPTDWLKFQAWFEMRRFIILERRIKNDNDSK